MPNTRYQPSRGDGEPDHSFATEQPTVSSRLEWNPLTQEYVAQAPTRMQRRELSTSCPFCDDLKLGRVPPDTQAWVRPNDFPALRPPTGECYILIYSPDHEQTFAALDVPQVVRIIGLWHQVYRDLSARYPCVMTWETSGESIGQTQRHPHGQTYAVNVVPDTIAREMDAILDAQARGRDCPFCELLREEEDGPRVVVRGEHWLGFVPRFARYPYQITLIPRQHTHAITGIPLESPAAEELAAHLLHIVRAYNVVYEGAMPYMLAVHQLADERFHLHIELLPVGRAPGKLKFAASSEAAWGFWVNDSLPEVKAGELRAALTEDARG